MKNSILNGAYDLHIHTGPDLLPRKINDFEMAQRVINTGMAGFASKSHYFCTTDRAKLVKQLYPECDCIGTMWLNNSVGGLNPYAVDVAGRAGTKIIGMPTVDTETSIYKTFTMPPEKRPFWATIITDMKESGFEPTPVKISENGKLVPAVYEILDIIAKYNMILATGHYGPAETSLLVKAAYERKVERIICTHVSATSNFHDIDTQKEMVRLGAYMEHTVIGITTGKVDWDMMYNQIKTIGVDHVIISTDFGQPKNPYPDEGLLYICERLQQEGMPDNDIRKMIVNNPVQLLKS
jgi:sugar phosphate isomerase/epimerase